MENNLTPSGDLVLEQLGINPHNLSADFPTREQRLQYRAVVQWLTDYKPKSDATNLEKVRGYLEALHHTSQVKNWQLIKSILQLPIFITPKIGDLSLPLDEYLIWNNLDNIFLVYLNEIIASFPETCIDISYILILKARLLGSSDRLAACNLLQQIIDKLPEESQNNLEAHVRLGIYQINAAAYKKGIVSLHRSLQMIDNLLNYNLEDFAPGKLNELKSDILEYLAFSEMTHSRFSKAIELYTQVLNIRKQNNLRHKLISPLVHIGIVHRRIADYNRAIYYLSEAKIMAEKLHDDNAIAWIPHHLAWVFINQGKLLLAEEQSKISLQGYKKMESQAGQGGIADVYEQLGFIHIAKSEIDAAYEKFEMALNIRKTIKNSHGAASCMMGLALASWHKRHYLKFLRFLLQGFNGYYKIGVLNRRRIFRMMRLAYTWTLGKLNWTM